MCVYIVESVVHTDTDAYTFMHNTFYIIEIFFCWFCMRFCVCFVRRVDSDISCVFEWWTITYFIIFFSLHTLWSYVETKENEKEKKKNSSIYLAFFFYFVYHSNENWTSIGLWLRKRNHKQTLWKYVWRMVIKILWVIYLIWWYS